jgi:NitT/TauT family transport system substrate-binding protein
LRGATVVVVAAIFLGLWIQACGPSRPAITADGRAIVRLAFFPNVTHAPALVGIARGTFANRLGPRVRLEEQVFNAGPVEIEAVFAGQIDIGYVGPGPALNGFVNSRGKALRVIAGASSGGVSLVVRTDSGIWDIAGLAGKRISSPQLGGTQDISLRSALRRAGLQSTDRGGSVVVLPTANPDTLTLFRRKEIDAAWAPEPWVSRLVKEADGRILVDERDEWPDRKFATTVVIARTQFLSERPELASRFIEAHVDTVHWINQNRMEASRLVGEQIRRLTTRQLPEDILGEALSRTDFLYDPLSPSILTIARRARDLGYLRMEDDQDIGGMFDLRLLNRILTDKGLSTIGP